MINLKQLRLDKSMKQVQLAQKLNINRTTISKMEKTNVIPTIDILVQYSKEFNISTDVLLGLKEESVIADKLFVLAKKYNGYVLREANHSGKSYNKIVDDIFKNHFERIKQSDKLEDKWIDHDQTSSNIEGIENFKNKLNLMEELKKIAEEKGINISIAEENIFLNVIDMLLTNKDDTKITDLYLYINNMEKFVGVTKKIIKLDDNQIKLIKKIIKEFKNRCNN